MLPLIADSGAILLLMTSAMPQNNNKMIASCLPQPPIFLHFLYILLCFAGFGHLMRLQIADAAASCLILLPMLPLIADSGAILLLMASATPQNDAKMFASCVPQRVIVLHALAFCYVLLI